MAFTNNPVYIVESSLTGCPVLSKMRESQSFGYACPTCLRPIEKNQQVCSGCGRSLFVTCPACGKQTFVDERCQVCGAGLMIQCQNPRCGQMQFFQNEKCTACGKKFKNKK